MMMSRLDVFIELYNRNKTLIIIYTGINKKESKFYLPYLALHFECYNFLKLIINYLPNIVNNLLEFCFNENLIDQYKFLLKYIK